tara:strand:+ start:337 stop:534 length:198 start_codon:yes stop_codon:yes gene_type:complete
MKVRTVQLKIVRNFLDDEYCVQWIEGGVIDEAKCYYTNSRMDALLTANAIHNENYSLKNNIKIKG